MSNYSILGPEDTQALVPSVTEDEEPLRGGHELMLPHQKRLLLDELRFAGNQGNHSLEAWARQDLEGTLQLLADRAQYITSASGAAIALRNGDEVICRASSGPAAPEIGTLLQVNSGLTGESIRTRQVRRCDDAAADPRVNHATCRALGIASFAVVPLIRNGQVIGIIEIFSGLPNSFDERDIIALQRMGEMVNTALDHVENARQRPAGSSLELNQVRLQTDGDGKSPAAPDGGKLSDDQRRALNDYGISTCGVCGFPVADGQTICADCESAPHPTSAAGVSADPEDAAPSVDAPVSPLFLSHTLVGDDAAPTGIVGWIKTHKFLAGGAALGASALVMFLLR